MLKSDFKGRKCSGCGECKHADHDKMKCYPESEDCKSEYDLTEEDFHKEARCDFFHHKQKTNKVRFLWKRGENKWHVIIVRTVILMIVMMVGIAIKIVKVLS